MVSRILETIWVYNVANLIGQIPACVNKEFWFEVYRCRVHIVIGSIAMGTMSSKQELNESLGLIHIMKYIVQAKSRLYSRPESYHNY